jgi:polar amino acid transport system substrate-binding protein
MKYWLIGLMIILVCLSGCSKDNSNVLKVGMELAYPPFEMTDTEGNPMGVSVDLAKALAKQLNRPIEIQNIRFDGLIPALRTGKIDLIISSMSITEERKKSISFSDPYCRSYLALLINKKSSVNSAADLNHKDRKIAVKKGTTAHLYSTKNFDKAEVMVFDKEDACVLEVVQGKADVFIYDQMSTYRNWQKNKETTRAQLRPFQKRMEYWAVAAKKNDKELLTKVNSFLENYKKEGGFEKLGNKYFAEQKKVFKELGIPFFF